MKRLFLILLTGVSLVACASTDNVEDSVMDDETVTDAPNEDNTLVDDAENMVDDTMTPDSNMSYIESLGFSNVQNINGSNPYSTYNLNPSIASDPMIFNQWLYSWADPANYMDQDVSVYEYTAARDNLNYTVYTLSSNDEVIGGYYFEDGTDISDLQNATILDDSYPMTSEEDFRTNWNQLFNITDDADMNNDGEMTEDDNMTN